jgi:sterol desaturase/sphingolipid hydroxylase (fatty acid hydroxylase superfamily)
MMIDVVELRWLFGGGDELTGVVPPGTLKIASAVAVFCFLVYLEARQGAFPALPQDVRQSYLANLGVLFCNEALFSLVPLQAVWTVVESNSEWGLLRPISNRYVRLGVALVLYDFMLYAWHRTIHSHDLLWRFHRIHHSDRCMNASTSFRVHGIEVLATVLLKMLFMMGVGVDSALMLLNEAIVTASVVLHHANVRLPAERLLGLLFVVPSQHRVHHSALRAEHDRNYGAIFSVWDRWFGTLATDEPTNLGLANVDGLNLGQLLLDGLPSRMEVAVWASWARSATRIWMGSQGRRACPSPRSTRLAYRRPGGRPAGHEAHRSRRSRPASRLMPPRP